MGAVVSESLGQDANYDLMGYHLYNGGALLHGRFYRDLLAAGMQSYFNPLLDAVYTGLAIGPLLHWPRILASVMGLWYGAAIFLAIQLARLLYPGRPFLLVAGVALGVTGVAMVTQVGTTFNEVQVAAIMLGGLLALLRPAGSWRPLVLGGLLFGVAAGLKLTAATFAPAAVLAVCSTRPDVRSVIRTGLLVTAGWLAGFAITDGWWALMLFQRFGSPTFPMFNGVFRSPWFPPVTFVDDRFLPKGMFAGLFYPILWLTGSATQVSEIALRDPRGAIALCLGLANIALPLIRKAPRLLPPQRAMLVFLAIGYGAWVSTSGILRYAVVLEVMAGLVTPLLVARLLPAWPAKAAVGVVLAATLLTTRYGSWGRIPYGDLTLHADVGWVQPNTLVVVTLRSILSDTVTLMPHQRSINVIKLDTALLDARGWALQDEVSRRIRDHDGPIVVMTTGDPNAPAYELGEIGLDPMMTNCRPIGDSFVSPGPEGPFACDAHRRPLPTLLSPFWAQAATRYRTLMQSRDASMSMFGTTYLKAAGPAARGTRIVDWGDLLWNGVRPLPDLTTQPIDPTTLYILDPATAGAMAGRIDPAKDKLGIVDGVIVLAPGWAGCSACTAAMAPFSP